MLYKSIALFGVIYIFGHIQFECCCSAMPKTNTKECWDWAAVGVGLLMLGIECWTAYRIVIW